MKKLMFMLALAAGFVANAGTVNWAFWDAELDASNDYVLYLMEGTLTDGATINSITDIDSAKTFVAGAIDSGVLDHTDELFGEGNSKAIDGGNKSFYALLFNADSIDDASKYLVVGNFTANVPGSGGASLNMAADGRTSASAGWQAVPEPTSGLLMLVGLGALALRRKRA